MSVDNQSQENGKGIVNPNRKKYITRRNAKETLQYKLLLMQLMNEYPNIGPFEASAAMNAQIKENGAAPIRVGVINKWMKNIKSGEWKTQEINGQKTLVTKNKITELYIPLLDKAKGYQGAVKENKENKERKRDNPEIISDEELLEQFRQNVNSLLQSAIVDRILANLNITATAKMHKETWMIIPGCRKQEGGK